MLSKSYDALQTLGEADMLRIFVMTTLKKLSQVKPDLVRVDNHWEEWSMKEFIENLQKWLKRNKVDDSLTDAGDSQKREQHWCTRGKRDAGHEPKAPSCLYCQGDHWGGVWSLRHHRKKKFLSRKETVLQLWT